jgi:hypothetical protein
MLSPRIKEDVIFGPKLARSPINLNVTGKLTKGSGSFKIDHPLDPANKYLSHSLVEMPSFFLFFYTQKIAK